MSNAIELTPHPTDARSIAPPSMKTATAEHAQSEANCLLLALHLPAQVKAESTLNPQITTIVIAVHNPSASSVQDAKIESTAPIAQNSAASQSAASSPSNQKNTLFDGGPPNKIQSGLGLIKPEHANIARRMMLVILICWVPLAVLTTAQGQHSAFFSNFGVHARYLIAAPLLIFAETICVPRMNALARSFLDAGLIDDADRNRFDAAMSSTRRLINSTAAEVLTFILAFLLTAGIIYTTPADMMPSWYGLTNSDLSTLSPAGWWGLLVSLPLLLALQLGWLWRFILWTRFLWLMSRLNLHLVPSHPDCAAGLRFVGYSSQAFTVLAFALAAIPAGTIADDVAAGSPLAAHIYFIGGFVACTVALLNAPLLLFFGNLLREWWRGTFEYSALADRFGREFEHKWLNRKPSPDDNILEQQDFSAATDLYQVVDRVYAMWFIPLHLKSIIFLAGATLLPFVPIALMTMPFDVLVNKLVGMLI